MGGDTYHKMASLNQEYPTFAEHPTGKQITKIHLDRLRQFTDGGQYRQQGLLAKLYPEVASGPDAVKLSVYSPPDLSRPTFKEATSNTFKDTKVGESFGPSWSTHWFKIHITIPERLLKYKQLEFVWDAGNEGMIWTKDGEVVHGLTGNGERTEWILPEEFKDGKEHMFYIEMACNGMFGNAPGGDSIQPPDPNRYFQLHTAQIHAVNLDARALYFDFWEIGDAAREFPSDSQQAHEALQVGNRIMDTFIAGNGSDDAIRKCREVAKEYLGKKVDSHEVYSTDKQALVTGIGYCHIDTCWLWPFAETKRKVARSWSNQLDLMDRYPELRFCCSQAQQYKWLEQNYPSLFDRVKRSIKEGKFQPIGGSWVEHDTNLPSGESLVRQFLYGQRYFESRFGVRCKTFWLPDTFGYSTQLPQLCRLAGMTRFLTQKLSWNNINKFPHTTFNWVALDNSQVICHMPPSETYTAEANFGDLKRSISQHQSLDQDHTSLLVFGKGDGGGGPTYQHLEKLRRCRGISDTVGLLPRVKLGDSADDFFERLEKRVNDGLELATWYGELYFELHRGTYTTQANNKKNNRLAENMLRDVEYLATMATIKNGFGEHSAYKYPKEDIDNMWEDVLLCQFHDCLPGSSIEMCYRDSDEIYARVFKTGERLISSALEELGFDQESEYTVAINTLPWARTEVINRPEPDLCVWNHPGRMRCILGTHKECTVSETSPGVFSLKNSQYALEISNGAITSLIDLDLERELIPKNSKAAQLVIYDDKPLYWQAWDVEVYHLRSRQELPASKSYISSTNPLRVSVTIETPISEKSHAKTVISLPAAAGSPSAIEINTTVTWHETMKFLKVEFPVDIVNTEASYETQFGIVRRPTHYNTSWDMARFEVCGHKWADLSEATYGVSILNDSKYGFAVAGNVMRLSLLRSPKAPDANADMGTHEMRYAIFPHKGGLGTPTVRKAIEFNQPVKIVKGSSEEAKALLRSFEILGADNLVLDTIKRGEDDDDVSRGEIARRTGKSVIVRIYDALGGKARGTLWWGKLGVKSVKRVNLLEDELEDLSGGIGECALGYEKGKGLSIEVRAFEVLSLRLEF
ncbi:glycoside hydrolase family 38 protein [Sporormia fimetaria CBS 119925]|uniref:Alpha-mannosidase n=1 Tax=Sporormia fimetaria CBS 119925 TaxID=1340428 RepID=A0A6A6VIZ8_9PLEO|nr:glycoside hydrolase family 38 protein [Sporormia fimetaria CBS 119925]